MNNRDYITPQASMSLRACKAVNLQDANLEVPGGTERRIVEGGTAVRLAVSDVFIHPYCLTISANTKIIFSCFI